METTCTSPRHPAESGNLRTGRGEPSLLSAENPTPGAIDTVKHDIVHPRDDRREHASLPRQFSSRAHGLVSPADPPRDSHTLLEERTSLQRSSVLPTEYAIPTIASNPFAVVPRGESEEVNTGLPESGHPPLSIAPRDDDRFEGKINAASKVTLRMLLLFLSAGMSKTRTVMTSRYDPKEPTPSCPPSPGILLCRRASAAVASASDGRCQPATKLHRPRLSHRPTMAC